MRNNYNKWDLYTQQPVVLFHPALASTANGGKIFLAGVTRAEKQNITVLWNADYIISSNMPGGMPGSGFPDNPIQGTPFFDERSGAWILSHLQDKDYVYRLVLPNDEELRQWETWKQYVPSIQELQGNTQRMFGG